MCFIRTHKMIGGNWRSLVFGRDTVLRRSRICESEVFEMITNPELQTGGSLMEKYLENYPPVLSVDEVAAILGVTGKTIRHLTKAGDIGSIKVGRLIRIPKARLIDYLERQERRGDRHEE